MWASPLTDAPLARFLWSRYTIRIEPSKNTHGKQCAGAREKIIPRERPSQVPRTHSIRMSLTGLSQLSAQANGITIADILLSQRRVKGIRVSINAHFFGTEWAAGQSKDRFTGEIASWKSKGSQELYILW